MAIRQPRKIAAAHLYQDIWLDYFSAGYAKLAINADQAEAVCRCTMQAALSVAYATILFLRQFQENVCKTAPNGAIIQPVA